MKKERTRIYEQNNGGLGVIERERGSSFSYMEDVYVIMESPSFCLFTNFPALVFPSYSMKEKL